MSMPPLLPPAIDPADEGVRNVRLLSVLRWLAVAGQLATILVVRLVMDVPLPLVPMLGALAVLAAMNLLIAAIAARRTLGDLALFATLLVDMASLTVQCQLSGGVANPFVQLYLLQVVIAAVLLPAAWSWATVALASLLFAALAWSPEPLPASVGARLSEPFVVGAWISFTLAAALLVLVIVRIVHNLAEREARLAALRERAAEEEHVVRMGLLASGAAHELGTPLASLAVMLGDWRADPAVRAHPDLLADVTAMAGEVARCKHILGHVLLAAGEVPGEAPMRTSLSAFVRDTVAGWGQTGSVPVTIGDAIHPDPRIVADTPLKQTLVNLLDNAVEAGAGAIRVTVTLVDDTVSIAVRDDGRGFVPAMLADVGKPYASTKDREGAGLGLFLATNVLRTLGGHVAARNVAGGGGEVALTLPLQSIAVDEPA